MRLTKLGHACVRLEKKGAVLVIDPGIWSGPDPLAGANAVLVTHEHSDHLDPALVRAALGADTDVQLWANPSVAGQFAEFGERVHPVAHGDAFDAAGFDVHVYGREHARILPGIPVIANTGFAVDATVFHPGDSFTVPDDPVPMLLMPVSAPWLKLTEVAEFVRASAPVRGIAIHDAILSDAGVGLLSSLLMALRPDGSLSRLEPGSQVEL